MPLTANSLLVKATLLLSSSLTVMAGATIAPSLPAMRDYFAATPFMGIYAIAFLAMAIGYLVISVSPT